MIDPIKEVLQPTETLDRRETVTVGLQTDREFGLLHFIGGFPVQSVDLTTQVVRVCGRVYDITMVRGSCPLTSVLRWKVSVDSFPLVCRSGRILPWFYGGGCNTRRSPLSSGPHLQSSGLKSEGVRKWHKLFSHSLTRCGTVHDLSLRLFFCQSRRFLQIRLKQK